MDEIEQESFEGKLKRMDTMLQEIDPNQPEAFEKMRSIAKTLVELLELNFKIMASARKMLTL